MQLLSAKQREGSIVQHNEESSPKRKRGFSRVLDKSVLQLRTSTGPKTAPKGNSASNRKVEERVHWWKPLTARGEEVKNPWIYEDLLYYMQRAWQAKQDKYLTNDDHIHCLNIRCTSWLLWWALPRIESHTVKPHNPQRTTVHLPPRR